MASNGTEKCQIPDKLWEQVKSLLPPGFAIPIGGCPGMDDRKAMEAILYMLHTGCKLEDIPPSLGSPSIIHMRFQEWRKYGVFQRMWLAGILTYDELRNLVWHGIEEEIANNGQ